MLVVVVVVVKINNNLNNNLNNNKSLPTIPYHAMHASIVRNPQQQQYKRKGDLLNMG